MDEPLVQQFRALAVPMLTLSTDHLSRTMRALLRYHGVSVPVHPTDKGGFVHVGASPATRPDEPDLAALFDTAVKAGIVWLHFDEGGAIVEGLPRFGDGDVPR